jgi:hypothetical protein
VQDDRVGFRALHPGEGQAVLSVILARRRNERAVHSLLLDAQHHHDVGAFDGFVDLPVQRRHRSEGRGEESGRRAEGHVGAHLGEEVQVRSRDA